MSTGNAEWFFDNVREGDIVKVVNSDGDTMETFGNGFGDWNLDWDEVAEGSALDGRHPGGRQARPTGTAGPAASDEPAGRRGPARKPTPREHRSPPAAGSTG